MDVRMKTPKDSPALVRAGERWGFAAYLWADAKSGEWCGKVCWNPEMPQAVVDVRIRELCVKSGMGKVEPEDEIA